MLCDRDGHSADMMPIFYINLESRPDRRAFMERQFAELGLSAERVRATTLDEVPPEMVAGIERPGQMWRVNHGDLACGLSHQHVWRLMLERGLEEALILEDDAVLSAAIRPYLQAGLTSRLGAGLIRLETRRQPVALGSVVSADPGIDLRELGSTHKGTAAYIINRIVAEAAPVHPLVNLMAVDRFLFGHGGPHLYRTRIMQADPAPVVQLDRTDIVLPEGRSDIAGMRSSRRSARRPRKRALADVVRLELRLWGARALQRARDPHLLRPRRLVGFVDDEARS